MEPSTCAADTPPRCGAPSHPNEWLLPLPGDAGQDGALLRVLRALPLYARCGLCNATADFWHVELRLPTPFPVTISLATTCAWQDQLRSLASGWRAVAAMFDEVAKDLRDASMYDDQQAWLEEAVRRAQRARWLADKPRPVRRLALEAWRNNPMLELTDLEMIAHAVLSE